MLKIKKNTAEIISLLLAVIITYFSVVGILFVHNYTKVKNREIEIKVEVSGKKNEESKGYEARILDVSIAGNTLELKGISEEQKSFLYDNGMLVGYGGKLVIPTMEIQDLSIEFLKHPWSGIVRITIDTLGVEEEYDLYSPSDDIFSYFYHWDRDKLWEASYHLQGFPIGQLIMIFMAAIVGAYFCIFLIRRFFGHVGKGDLRLVHVAGMAFACFMLCLLALYSLFRVFRWGLIAVVFLGIWYYLYKNRGILEKHQHYMYAIVYAVSATLVLFLLPPGHVPDEYAHYVKVYEASILGDSHTVLREGYEHQGKVYIYLPKAFQRFSGGFMKNQSSYNVKYDIEQYYELYSDKLDRDNLEDYTFWFGNTAKLNIISYLPGILLQMFMNLFHLPPILCIQMIRFLHMLFTLMVGYVAIKIMPYYKRVLFLIMLLPMTVQQSIGINQDWLTNLVCFILTAYVLSIMEKEHFEKKFLLCLMFLSFILGNVKMGYFGVLFLVLAIPYSKFSDRREEFMSKTLILLPCLLLTAIQYGRAVQTAGSDGALPYYEISFITSHPFKTAWIYINTLLERGSNLFLNGLITGFGWYTHYTRNLLTLVEGMLVVFLAVGANESRNKNVQWICSGIFVVSSIFIFTSLFLGWTTINAVTVYGLQPRYFIIPVLCLSISVQNQKVLLNLKHKNFCYTAMSLAILCNAVLTIGMGFYN